MVSGVTNSADDFYRLVDPDIELVSDVLIITNSLPESKRFGE
jgi:hypothetical protein